MGLCSRVGLSFVLQAGQLGLVSRRHGARPRHKEQVDAEATDDCTAGQIAVRCSGTCKLMKHTLACHAQHPASWPLFCESHDRAARFKNLCISAKTAAVDILQQGLE